MCLVQHDDGVLADVGVDETLSLEHTIRHVLDARLRTCAVLETDCVPDFLPQPAPNFLRDTLGDRHGGDTPRLCTTDLALVSKAILGQVLSHLSRFA